ncbi:MAG TPA: hypothetical protein VFP72_17795 [Kineosporiaceae bacterium]|nr:hypothetical protein [Kineosporiaceae bacterium]
MTADSPEVGGADSGSPFAVPSAEGRTPWQHYVDLIRALDAERDAEEQRTSVQRQGAETAALEVERLTPLLIDQGAELTHLARRLRLAQPRLSAEPQEVSASPYELVVLAIRATARASSHAREAHQLATRPRFLPGWPSGLRNFLLYLGWALLALLVQYRSMAVDANANAVVVLVGIPALAYIAGLLTVRALGSAPLAVVRPHRSARLGALICFGMFPLSLLVIGLHSLFA